MPHPDVPGRVSAPDREDEGDRRRARHGTGRPPGRGSAGSALRAGLLGFLGTLAVVVVVVVAVRAGGGAHPGGDTASPGASGSSSPATAAALRGWSAGGGTTAMATLSRDVSAVQDDSSAGDTTSMGQDCVTLQTDLRSAEVYPAIPEATVQAHWSKALSLLAQAAADCSDGATTGSSSLLAKSVTELRSGSTELDLATTRADELAGN